MALVMIHTVLLHFDCVVKFTVTNLNKAFINTGGEGGCHSFMNLFHKIPFF